MPAINVARTDTFEIQRQKINQIGDQIFNISQGGSDLATGNLKLGDGSISNPSLSFTSDSDTGLYKNDLKTIGFVSGSKLLSTFYSEKNYFFNNTTFVKKSINSNGLIIVSPGENYDSGNFTNIPVIGGSGIEGSLNVTVEKFLGNITTLGQDYKPGSYSGIDLSGGSGIGAEVNFTVFSIQGSVTNTGSGYSDGLYSDIPFQGGSGSGATFGCNINNGVISSVTLTTSGIGYRNGDILTANNSDLGGSGSGFQYTIENNPGLIDEETFQFSEKGTGYQVNDILTLSNGVTGVSTTLDSNTSDITVTTQQAALLQSGFFVTQTGGSGVLTTGGGIGGGVVTILNIIGTTITLSAQPEVSGSATLDFTPQYGVPTTAFEYTINTIGSVGSVTVSDGGSGYSIGDVLSVSPYNLVQPIQYSVIVNPVSVIVFDGLVPSSFVSIGQSIYVPGGKIQSTQINSGSTLASEANNTYTNISASGGSGSSAVFSVSRGFSGDVSIVNVTSGGLGYQANDVLTILGSDIGGSSPADDLIITVSAVSLDGDLAEVYDITSSGGYITNLVCEPVGILDTDAVAVEATVSPRYEINTIQQENKYFIDTGSGASIYPDITLYAGNTYRFNNSQQSAHPFRFSRFRDGTWSPSDISGITATLDSSSQIVTVSSTTGIVAGMSVAISGGGGLGGGGALSTQTLVLSVDSPTQITLSEVPISSGEVTLEFIGYSYSDGVNYQSGYSEILVTEDTPSPLYYYCSVHPNMAGFDNNEAELAVNLNNPKIFGSGLSIVVDNVTSVNSLDISVKDRKITTNAIEAETANINNITATSLLTATNISGNTISLQTINSNSGLTISASGQNVTANCSNFKVGTLFNIQQSNGNLQTSGNIKTLSTLNVNDKISITNNVLSSTTGNDIVFTPASSRVVKVNALSALVIPVGDTNGRPGSGIRQDGAIRFNTDTNQYEGYSASSSSWSSLGGVRDIDGNTYIIAELTAGANDNTLWFYNDNSNTLNLSKSSLDFRSVKTISSTKLGLPSYTFWSANTPVSIGSFIRYRNNLYQATSSGVTGGLGTEPIHLQGSQNSGTVQLTWYSNAVSQLSIDGIEEFLVAPNKDAPLIVNGGLKLGGTTSDDWNTISTLVEDLTIAPNPGKKVVVKAYTHLAIPSGNNNQRNTAAALPGSIRFNTEIQQFEGYSGVNWSSLGGVRDVDGNTYIIPETAPAANENILYFYNDNLNTLQLTRTSLDFTNIDTITTSGLNNLSIDTPLVTLNSNDTTIDNRDVDRTFISTSKQFLDLGLSSGLVVDPVLRLDDQGDVYLNTTFGSGTFNGVKVLDGQLKEFELADYAIKTTTFQLAKGGAESGSFVLYDSGSRKGCKVTVVSKSSSGKRSMTEYSVIDNGTDIFHNEFGSLNTSLDQYTALFDFNATNETRISLTLSNDHANGDIITFTILVQVIK